MSVVIEVRELTTRFGRQVIHDRLNLQIRKGELVALIGGSGTGKSVLVREIIGLHRPTSGEVQVLDTPMWSAAESELARVRRRIGMMFQDGALFSSLTVAQNVAAVLDENVQLSPALRDALAADARGTAWRCGPQDAQPTVRRHAQARRSGQGDRTRARDSVP